MGCCISGNAVNDLFSCFTCLDVAFSEGKRDNLLRSVYSISTLVGSQIASVRAAILQLSWKVCCADYSNAEAGAGG